MLKFWIIYHCVGLVFTLFMVNKMMNKVDNYKKGIFKTEKEKGQYEKYEELIKPFGEKVTWISVFAMTFLFWLPLLFIAIKGKSRGDK